MNGLADKPPMAAKPPMGYSSWNALGRCSTEALMEPQLTAMVDLGLWHPLDHLDVVRRHLLQQLLQERHAARRPPA